MPAIAALHLARGEPAAAAALAERRLRELGDACLEGGILVELWVEAEAMRSPRRAVGERARELVDLVAGPDCPALVARAERALGRALLADGDPGGASPHIEAALRELAGLEMPLESARTRLLLAHALGADEREAAVAEARRALDGFEEVGARRDAGRAAALLRSLGVPAARRGPRGLGLLTRREREVLELLGEGLSNPEIAERLVLSRKTVEHHVARVLAKLRLRGRGEATAYALRHLPGRDSSTG